MADFLSILKRYWGYDSFRGIQLDIIESICSGRDTLGLMPTGGGKSITFQVSSMAMEGVCLVVTPLISLMKDQIAHLRQKGIRSAALHGGMSHEELLTEMDNVIYGDYKFLYVSPERFSSDLFLKRLTKMNVNFITIDEAHCISQWGYDFRPSYLALVHVRRVLPGRPVLALTATATPKVVQDIQDKLGFAAYNVFRMSFERKNLTYTVRRVENKYQELYNILRRTSGSAIVYTRNRRKTREIADWLNENGIKALYYHAGLDHADRDIRQVMWQEEDTRVMVATNAFGMGIDKANVRLVVHVDVPDSIEAYFQEAGRAGRDGGEAQAVLLCNGNDRTRLLRRIDERYPSKEYVRQVYEDVCAYLQIGVGDGGESVYEFHIDDFCRSFHYFPVPLVSALHLLTRAGYWQYREEEENKSRIFFLLSKDSLYKWHWMPSDTEAVIEAILRTYGGVFTEYVYIEESRIAQKASLTLDQVYHILLSLGQQRILHYIPRKRIPRIFFPYRRVDTEDVWLTPDVYEDRKKECLSRIHAMIGYMEERSVCRSRMLLAYFGDTDCKDCGQCDVCRERNRGKKVALQVQRAADAIVSMLADGEGIPLDDIYHLPFDTLYIKEALQWLLDEEELEVSDGMLRLK